MEKKKNSQRKYGGASQRALRAGSLACVTPPPSQPARQTCMDADQQLRGK